MKNFHLSCSNALDKKKNLPEREGLAVAQKQDSPTGLRHNFMGDQKDSEQKNLVVRINQSMKTLGLCSTAAEKVIQVLGIIGKKIENKRNCHSAIG